MVDSVPMKDRYLKMGSTVRKYVGIIADIKAKDAKLAAEQQHLFLYLVEPWLSVVDEGTIPQTLVAQRKKLASDVGFNGEQARTDLETILAEDKHLLACCPTPVHLAYFMDLFAIKSLSDISDKTARENALTKGIEELELITYHSGPFKRIALSHLFNLDAFSSSVRIGTYRIERLDSTTVSSVLGEQVFPTFLHQPATGEYFLVAEEEGPCDDVESWLQTKRMEAIELVRVLQYYKRGFLSTDYSAPHFLPLWVNQIRKWGVYFIGEVRRQAYLGGSRPYRLLEEDVSVIENWVTLYTTPAVSAKLKDHKNEFRQALLRAGDYYESSRTRVDPVERLITLSIALEALFSPGDSSELSFRISQTASQLVGDTARERVDIYATLRDMYKRRSSLFHGSYKVQDYYENKFVSDIEVEDWADIVRRGILRLLTLYLRGEPDRRRILERLLRAGLDSDDANRLRELSNCDSYIIELVGARTPHDAIKKQPDLAEGGSADGAPNSD